MQRRRIVTFHVDSPVGQTLFIISDIKIIKNHWCLK